MTTFLVRARPVGALWHVEVPALDRVTQARNAGEIETMASDLISIITEETEIELTVEFDLSPSIRKHLDSAAAARKAEANARGRAAHEIRCAARELHDSGLPLRDVGIVLGVSRQRAHQLVS